MHAGTEQGSTVPLDAARSATRRKRASRTVVTVRATSMTGRARASLAAVVLGMVVLVLASPVGAAQGDDDPKFVNVVEASGLLDPVVVDFLEDAIADSERTGAEALVIQLDSEGSAVSRDELDALLVRMHDSSVPIAVWV